MFSMLLRVLKHVTLFQLVDLNAVFPDVFVNNKLKNKTKLNKQKRIKDQVQHGGKKKKIHEKDARTLLSP